MVATTWRGAFCLGWLSGGIGQGLDEQVVEDGLELEAFPFQVFSHHMA